MRTFITKTLVYLTIVSIILAFIIFGSNYIVRKNAKFVLDRNINTVIFGHSHPECAYNDGVITDFKNLSQSAESYFYTYQKVKNILNENTNIKTVFIEYTNNQIDKKMDEWTWGSEYMSTMYPLYSSFIDNKDLKILISNNKKDFLSCVAIATKKNLLRILTRRFDFKNDIGGYLKLAHFVNSKDSINKKQTNVGISAINIHYLKVIIDFCKSKNVKIFLVRSPQHKNYEYLSNEKKFQEIRAKYFSTIPFLDFNKFNLKDNEFADYGHLNINGANRFSKWFNTFLKDNLLKITKENHFISDNNINFRTDTTTLNNM